MIPEKNIFKLTLATVLLGVALLAGCTGASPRQIDLTLNGVSYVIDAVDSSTVDLLSLSTEFKAEVEVSNHRQFDRLSVGGVQLVEGRANVPVDVIGKDAYLTLEWARGRQGGTILLRTLHAGVPDVIASGRATSPGDFYLSYVYLRLIQKFDNAGNLVYYRFEPHQTEGNDDSSGWWDFKKHTVDGQTYYSYHAPDPAFADRIFLGYNPGKRVLLDDRYRPVREIHLLADSTGLVQEGDPIDGHDFYLFDLDHYIVSAYIERDGVYAIYLQEVEDGKVVFDWWSTDHPELAEWGDPALAELAVKDYVHFNSIDILPDGNWLLSLRHVSSVLKIDRTGGTGDILWRISGLELPAGLAFRGQHCVRWHDDGTMTLFNNGNGQGVTSLLRLAVDPMTGAVSGGGNLLKKGYPAYFSQACGALTFSDGHFIAGWGMADGTTTKDRLLTEFDADGNEQFSLRRRSDMPYILMGSSYRCVKE